MLAAAGWHVLSFHVVVAGQLEVEILEGLHTFASHCAGGKKTHYQLWPVSGKK